MIRVGLAVVLGLAALGAGAEQGGLVEAGGQADRVLMSVKAVDVELTQTAASGVPDPRITHVEIVRVPATTPPGSMLALKVTATVCSRGFPSVSAQVSRFSQDTATVEIYVETTCSNATSSFLVPIETDLVNLGFDPKSVKILWADRIIWPRGN